MIEHKSIRTLIQDGSLDIEVVVRLRDTLRLTDKGWQKLVRPGVWRGFRPSVADAVLQMAVKVALEQIGKELHARPGLDWEEKGLIDWATTNRERILSIQHSLPGLLKVGKQ